MPKMPKPRSALERVIDDMMAKGGKLHVAIDHDEIMACEYVICVLAEVGKMFPDNVFDFCCECGEKVQLRPYVPAGPKRICYGCAERTGITKKGNPVISQRTADEFAAYRKRN